MNIQDLARKAVDIIKNEWGLPQRGLLAGGSIGNIIWELVSGNKAIVNDIDIFIFDKKIESLDEVGLFQYKEEQVKYVEDYIGMVTVTETKDFYKITEASKDGIFNNILYQANIDDPLLVIKSFDINSTRVGYLIEEDKFYWTEDFENFLKTGNLEIVNLRTPCHSAIRLAKKADELKCSVSDLEFKILQHSVKYSFSDIIKTRFQERYKEMFDKYSEFLSKYFFIMREPDIEEYVKKRFDKDVNLWTIKENVEDNRADIEKILDISKMLIFNDDNLNSIWRSDEFLFYIRNIFNKGKLPDLWKKIRFFYIDKDYFDKEVSIDDLELLNRISLYAPKCINTLKGYKLSQQIDIIRGLLDRFKDDPIIAISILEKNKISKDDLLDEKNLLLLELSVRKEIVNDTKGKVSKILNLEDKVESKGNTIELSDIF
jgi:hypothetical protein